MCIYIYIYICVYIYTNTYIYIDIFIHTHTYAPSLRPPAIARTWSSRGWRVMVPARRRAASHESLAIERSASAVCASFSFRDMSSSCGYVVFLDCVLDTAGECVRHR